MIQKKRLTKHIIFSVLVHLIVALAMSRIYAEQPQRYMRLDIISAVKIQYKEPEPTPKPKVTAVSQPTERVESKKVEPKKKPEIVQKVEPPKVEKQETRINASGPGLAMDTMTRSGRGMPGANIPGGSGLAGVRGTAGDRPGMIASGGISHPTLTTTKGGSGLSADHTAGNMELPAGTAHLPGAGGKDVAGFRFGASQDGKGIGQANIAGRGGSGGSGGKGEEGPGQGLSTGTGRGAGSGKGTTGLGTGDGGGAGEIGTGGSGGSDSSGDGSGGKEPGSGGPGTGGYDAGGSRSNPSLKSGSGTDSSGSDVSPQKKDSPSDKRAEAKGKTEFKADVGKDIADVKTQPPEKPAQSGFNEVLQEEINKDLYSLRKMHEDWQNAKLSGIPKALQLTIELDNDKGKPKILKIDFHNSNIHKKINDDLTKKIREWKFKSLYDGKDDPEKWPIKLNGRISWQ